MITGRPCIDFLDDFSKWKEGYSLSFILVTIQVNTSGIKKIKNIIYPVIHKLTKEVSMHVCLFLKPKLLLIKTK